MRNFFLLVLVCVVTIQWHECQAGLFDSDDKMPGELLGYKQPCPVKKCPFVGVANGDLDLHMQRVHPHRYAAAMDVYNRSTFSAFATIFKTLLACRSGGFEGVSNAVQEFYSALERAGSDGQTIAGILSSDTYD